MPELPAEIDKLRNHIAQLTARVPTDEEARQQLEEALEELRVSLEELQATDEEVRQAKVELEAAYLALARDRQMYADLFEHTPEGYVVTDAAGAIQQANAAAATVFNVPASALPGKPLALYIAPEQINEFRTVLVRMARTGSGQRFEVRVRPRNAVESTPVIVTAAPDLGLSGATRSIRWLLHDLTWERRAEEERVQRERAEAAAKAARLAEDIVQAVPAPLLVMDQASRIIYCSQSFCLCFGYSPDHVRGKTLRELDPVWDFERMRVGLEEARSSLDGGTVFEFSADFRSIGERSFIVQISQVETPILEAPVLLLALQDVTESRKMDRMRDHFLAMVTHELRSPLATIKTALSMAEQDVPARETHEAMGSLQAIAEQTDRLFHLVDNLLDMAQIEAGAFSIAPQLIDLRRIIDLAAYQASENSGVPVEVQRPLPDEAAEVRCDRIRITQVLDNLLNNATRFAPPGTTVRIVVTAGPTPDATTGDGYAPDDADSAPAGTASLGTGDPGGETSAKRRIIVRVLNSGRSIPQAMQPLLFHKFSRLEQGSGHERTGTGLGLAIARGIIEAHGGRIRVQSPTPTGETEFSFALPLLPPNVVS